MSPRTATGAREPSRPRIRATTPVPATRSSRAGAGSIRANAAWSRVPMQRAAQLDEHAPQRLGEQLLYGLHSSTSRRTVRFSTLSMSTCTPIPGVSRGTRTIPSRSMVHSGVTISRSQ